MGRRTDYFTLGTGLLVIAGILVAVNGNLYGAATAGVRPRPYPFWTSGEMTAAYIVTAVAGFMFYAGFRSLPLPPWKRPKFPDIEIEIMGRQAHSDPGQPLWLNFKLRVTNLETDQNANITIRYRAKTDATTNDGKRFGETPFTSPNDDPLPSQFPDDYLTMPLNLLPQHSYGGNFLAMLTPFWRAGLTEPTEDALLVEDHVSKRAVAITTRLGLHNASTWTVLERDSGGYWSVFT